MPVDTDPSTTTSGGGTTVGATVRETGPGGTAHTLDVFLHVQSSKFTHAGAPLGAFQVTNTTISSPVGPGRYEVRVRSENICGASGFTFWTRT